MPVFVEAYTITYNLNGGVNDPDNPTSYVSDTSKLELKAPSRDGVAFLGWYIDSYLNGEETYYERSNFAKFQKNKKKYIANNLGNFTVTARWGLIPQTPKQDERGCYLIHDGAELYGLASVADTNFSTYAYEFNGCISLQNDIVVNKNLLNEKGEIALDDYVWWIQLNFNGTFEGNGYKISGLRGDDGFFLRIGDNLWSAKPSYVRNLGITDSYFSASTAGAVAGIVYNSARISNVYTDASVHGDNMAGGLFCDVYGGKPVTGVTVNDTYIERFGAVDHLVVVEKDDYRGALPNVAAKSDWHTTVQGTRVAMFGLVPGKSLLVMDVQGRILRRLQTESSMNIEFASSGRFLVRYGNETKAISIR